jgi:SEL1 protein
LDLNRLFYFVLANSSIASRAYKQALATLTTLSAHPPSFTFDPSLINNANSKSILSAFLPNLQGQGPIGSTLRIILKLHHQIVRRLSSVLGLGQETIGMGSRRKDEEQRLKAIKVLDLLEHSAELGNIDALYTLAKISLVGSDYSLFRSCF